MEKYCLLLIILVFIAYSNEYDSLDNSELTGEFVEKRNEEIRKRNEVVRLRNIEIEKINKAVKYHVELFAPIYALQQGSYEYVKAITRMRRAKAVEKKRQELIKMIGMARDHAKGFGSLNGDSSLIEDFYGYLDLVYKVLKEDYDKILDMEDIKEQSFDQEEALELAIDMANRKLHECYERLRDCEISFFKRYKIEYDDQKSELTKKIERANNALDYYSKINRVVIRLNRYYNYAMNAVSNKDLILLEQHISTISSYSKEGIKILKNSNSYNGDSDLIKAALKYAEFVRNEGLVYLFANVDFMLHVDKFEKLNKRFNKIKPADRTKEDVDRYNGEVNKYNEAIKNINKTNDGAYEKVGMEIKHWNEITEEFFKNNS